MWGCKNIICKITQKALSLKRECLSYYMFTFQKPNRFPPSRDIMPFSSNEDIILLTVLSDLLINSAICFCVSLLSFFKSFKTCDSSKVTSKVTFFELFGTLEFSKCNPKCNFVVCFALWSFRITIFSREVSLW